MTLGKYLLLMDWSGRQIRCEKRGAIPNNLAPILDRLELGAGEHPDRVICSASRIGMTGLAVLK